MHKLLAPDGDKVNLFKEVHNVDEMWSYWTNQPENYEIFNRAMISVNAVGGAAIAQDYSWGEKCDVIVDFGGGMGGLLGEILKTYPNVRGISTVRAQRDPDVKIIPKVAAQRGIDQWVSW